MTSESSVCRPAGGLEPLLLRLLLYAKRDNTMGNEINNTVEMRELRQALTKIEQRVRKLENQNTSEYATPNELAIILKTTPNNVYRKIRNGEIKAIKMGRSYKIPMSQYRPAEGGFETKFNEKLKAKIFGND
jgi:excisionase family DNA binding protein